MENYSNDTIKFKIIELTCWRVDAQTSYKLFVSRLKDINFWFGLAEKRQIQLTELQNKMHDWARYFLQDAVKCQAFYKKRKAELTAQAA